jgi:hypothetical protein
MASFLDALRQRNTTLGGTAAPSEPALGTGTPGPTPDYAKTAQTQFGFTGWNPDNFTQYDTLMKQANEYQAGGGADRAGIRDYLQGEFDSFFSPLAANYRQQMAGRGGADAGDANLMKDANFQNFVRSGQLPQQSVVQQWNNPAPAAATATLTETSTPGYTAGTDPRRQALYDEIMNRYRANEGMVGRDNPLVRGQADVFAAEQERARRDYLADLAESEGPLANLRGEQRMVTERMGRDTGAYEADLIAREMANRRGIQQSSLDSAVRLLDVDSQQSLARELGLSDLDLRRQQLGQSQDQFLRELAMREWDLLNRNDLIRRGLG